MHTLIWWRRPLTRATGTEHRTYDTPATVFDRQSAIFGRGSPNASVDSEPARWLLTLAFMTCPSGTNDPDRGRRHAGILAHSAEGSALCYLTFCQLGFAELGPHDHPDGALDFIPLARSMPAWERGDRAAVRAVLAQSVTRLDRTGAEFFICPDNTAHLALGSSGPPPARPGLHLPDVVADRAAEAGYRKVGVLGTRWTMNTNLYAEAFGRRGLDAMSPEPADRELVHEIIFSELLNGHVRSASRVAFVQVVGRLAGPGVTPVIGR